MNNISNIKILLHANRNYYRNTAKFAYNFLFLTQTHKGSSEQKLSSRTFDIYRYVCVCVPACLLVA